jgi:hemolysin activation/secretion protein
VSGNRTNTLINGKALPDLVPESVRTPQSGYVRVGLNGNGLNGPLSWSGSIYALQGIAALTPDQQRRELALAGISPGSATALAGFISAEWGLTPSLDISLQGAGQWAFRPLTNSMQFSVGADSGIRGLPGQLISGDNGWLGSVELSWTIWKNRRNVLQLVPFLGMGGVQTTIQGVSFSDSVGAGGILARWLHGNHWAGELGWIKQFQADDNPGSWTEWTLGKGLYAQVKYRF